MESPGRVPPHELKLKVGAKVMLIRNYSPKDRLVNGTTMIVKAIHKLWLRVETADGNMRPLLHHANAGPQFGAAA